MKKLILIALLASATVFSACGKKTEQISADIDIIEETQQNQNIAQPTTEPSQKPVVTEKEDKKETQSTTVNKSPTKTPQATKAPVETEKPSISLSDLSAKIIATQGEGQSAYSLLPENVYKGVYGIDKADYEDVKVYGSMMNVKANELILIKVKNSSDINKAKSLLENRKNILMEQWKTYLPDQYEIVKNSKIVTSGNYAALIIANDVSDAVKAFNSAVK